MKSIGTHCIASALTAFVPLSVHAHGGHLSELAGHSHWIGLAALAGVAAAGVLAAKLKGRREEGDVEALEAEPETEGETAT